MQTDTYSLPEFWAPALVNGDFSGFSMGDIAALQEWELNHSHLGGCRMCSAEATFDPMHDAYPFVAPCNCLQFTFEVIRDVVAGQVYELFA